MKQHRVVATLTVLILASGCMRHMVRGRPYAAKPQRVGSVAIYLDKAQAHRKQFDATFTIKNESRDEIVVDRNQVAVVGPNGDVFRTGGQNAFSVLPNQHLKMRVKVADADEALRKSPGVHLRFDGMYVNGSRIDAPVLTLDKPAWEAGTANKNFQAPPDDQVAWMRETLLNRLQAGMRPARGRNGAVAKNDPGADVPRRRLRSPGIKCAILPIEGGKKIKGHQSKVLDEVLLAELQGAGFNAIGPDDVSAVVGLEKMKDALGCDDASCFAEIGGALGVDYLVAGKVGFLGESTVVTLKLIDVRKTQVLARASRVREGDESQVPKLIAHAVSELTEQSKL